VRGLVPRNPCIEHRPFGTPAGSERTGSEDGGGIAVIGLASVKSLRDDPNKENPVHEEHFSGPHDIIKKE
jgi:hypothetical protein